MTQDHCLLYVVKVTAGSSLTVIHHVRARLEGLVALQDQLLELRQRCGAAGAKDQCGVLQRLEVDGAVTAPEAEHSHVGRSHGN